MLWNRMVNVSLLSYVKSYHEDLTDIWYCEASLVDPPLYCSGYYNGTQVTGAYNPSTNTYSNPGYKGYLCESGQVCLEITENNPDYGFVNYDTIYYAFLSVYTTVSLELWTELMYNNMDGDSAVVALYYCLSVYVISFIMLFLIFGKLMNGFFIQRRKGHEG